MAILCGCAILDVSSDNAVRKNTKSSVHEAKIQAKSEVAANGHGAIDNLSKDTMSAKKTTKIIPPKPGSKARYRYFINGELRGEYRIEISSSFQFNNERAFSINRYEGEAVSRIYRVSDYAYLGLMRNNKVVHKAQPYQVSVSTTPLQHRYIWADFDAEETLDVQQRLTPIGWHLIPINSTSHSAIEVETVFSLGAQKWIQQAIWLTALGLVYELNIESAESIETHRLVEYIEPP